MNDRLRYQIRPSQDGQWYFVQLGGNGEVIATSETYTRKPSAVRAAWNAGATQVFEMINGEEEYFEMEDQESKPPTEEEKENYEPQEDPPNKGIVENKRGTGDMPPEGDPVAPESPAPPAGDTTADQGPATGESTGGHASGN